MAILYSKKHSRWTEEEDTELFLMWSNKDFFIPSHKTKGHGDRFLLCDYISSIRSMAIKGEYYRLLVQHRELMLVCRQLLMLRLISIYRFTEIARA